MRRQIGNLLLLCSCFIGLASTDAATIFSKSVQRGYKVKQRSRQRSCAAAATASCASPVTILKSRTVVR